MQENKKVKKVDSKELELELFSDIVDDRSSGASALAEKTVLRIKELVKIRYTENLIPKSDVLHLISCAKRIRPTMVIIKNSVLLLERKVLSLEKDEEITKEEFLSATEDVLREIKKQRKKIIQRGKEIIRDFKSIAVVSFSSSVKSLLDSYPEKRAFFLEYDNYAGRLREQNIFPVSEDELGKLAQAGIMGADAVVISPEGKVKKIINGVPSLRFVEILSSSGIPIFVLAEELKFTQDDISPQEEGFDEVLVDEKLRKGIVLVS